MLIRTNAPPAMNNDTTLPSSFPPVYTKKISAAFDGGSISSDGGVMLLALSERKLVGPHRQTARPDDSQVAIIKSCAACTRIFQSDVCYRSKRFTSAISEICPLFTRSRPNRRRIVTSVSGQERDSTARGEETSRRPADRSTENRATLTGKFPLDITD